MLKLDAVESGHAPGVLVVLTTRTATLEMAEFARAKELWLRALRRRWPDLQSAWCIEFTTGYADRSGGERRPHWNYLLKGVGPGDVPEIRRLVNRIWCAHVDAEPAAQHVGLLYDAGGLIGYISNHFQKASQRPPKGFRGHRFGCSRGYFGPGITSHAQRMHARGSRRHSQEFWRAQEQGLQGWAALRRAEAQCAESARRHWVLCNPRGARIGRIGHDARRQVLPSDRREHEQMYGLARGVSYVARPAGVGSVRRRPAGSGRAAAHASDVVRQ
jgi:hypothetical protein